MRDKVKKKGSNHNGIAGTTKITKNTKVMEFGALKIRKSWKRKYQNLVRRKYVNQGNENIRIQCIGNT